VLWGRRPNNSFLLPVAVASSDCNFSSLNCSRKDWRSVRKEEIRSRAFSFLDRLSSLRARSV
jgi:hypothetical protein